MGNTCSTGTGSARAFRWVRDITAKSKGGEREWKREREKKRETVRERQIDRESKREDRGSAYRINLRLTLVGCTSTTRLPVSRVTGTIVIKERTVNDGTTIREPADHDFRSVSRCGKAHGVLFLLSISYFSPSISTNVEDVYCLYIIRTREKSGLFRRVFPDVHSNAIKDLIT